MQKHYLSYWIILHNIENIHNLTNYFPAHTIYSKLYFYLYPIVLWVMNEFVFGM